MINTGKLGAFALIAIATGIAAPATAAPVDLSPWTAESYDSVSGFNDGVWTVQPGNAEVIQSVNGQPTIFYSDFNAFGKKVTGTIRSAGGDNDYIGFVLGFNGGDSSNAAADYLLVDWKAATQDFDFAPNNTPGTTAPAGLAVSRVTGIPTADEFWGHRSFGEVGDQGGVTELARGDTLGNTGWAANTDYEFSFDFGPNNLVIEVDGVEQFNIGGVFSDGRLGFYNFSQASVTYSAFEQDQGTFPTIPLPATVWFSIAGFGLLGGVRQLRKRS